jgi:hypothetical protein
MNNIDIPKADQVLDLIKPLPNVIEALCADSVFFFKSVQQISTPERKAVLIQNINYLKSNLEQLERLLNQ